MVYYVWYLLSEIVVCSRPCMAKLLITGFEPFGGFAVNPSQEVVKRLSGNGNPVGAVTAILPVDAARFPRIITDLLLDLQPDLCLMLGQADGYAALSVERVAINLCDFRIPDNAGIQRIDEPIVPNGPAAYFSTAPVRVVVDAIRAAGIPANLSLSAGAYLCNMVYYVALHVCATHRLLTQCPVYSPVIASGAVKRRSALRSDDGAGDDVCRRTCCAQCLFGQCNSADRMKLESSVKALYQQPLVNTYR